MDSERTIQASSNVYASMQEVLSFENARWENTIDNPGSYGNFLPEKRENT